MSESFWCFCILAGLWLIRELHRAGTAREEAVFLREMERKSFEADQQREESERRTATEDEDTADPDWWKKSRPGPN